MQIEEVLRTCAISSVAEAAVASVGGGFAATVQRAATEHGMSVGEYAVTRVGTFAKNGREGEMRVVASAMATSEVPVLAGLTQILCLDLAAR